MKKFKLLLLLLFIGVFAFTAASCSKNPSEAPNHGDIQVEE